MSLKVVLSRCTRGYSSYSEKFKLPQCTSRIFDLQPTRCGGGVGVEVRVGVEYGYAIPKCNGVRPGIASGVGLHVCLSSYGEYTPVWYARFCDRAGVGLFSVHLAIPSHGEPYMRAMGADVQTDHQLAVGCLLRTAGDSVGFPMEAAGPRNTSGVFCGALRSGGVPTLDEVVLLVAVFPARFRRTPPYRFDCAASSIACVSCIQPSTCVIS